MCLTLGKENFGTTENCQFPRLSCQTLKLVVITSSSLGNLTFSLVCQFFFLLPVSLSSYRVNGAKVLSRIPYSQSIRMLTSSQFFLSNNYK